MILDIRSTEGTLYQDQTILLFCSIGINLNLEMVFFRGEMGHPGELI